MSVVFGAYEGGCWMVVGQFLFRRRRQALDSCRLKKSNKYLLLVLWDRVKVIACSIFLLLLLGCRDVEWYECCFLLLLTVGFLVVLVDDVYDDECW